MVIQPLLAQDSIFFFSSLASCFLASLACRGLRPAFESLGLQPRLWNQDANAGGLGVPYYWICLVLSVQAISAPGVGKVTTLP
jgi:hypothetical protein